MTDLTKTVKSVTLVHPESDQRIEVNPEHTTVYLEQGWRQPTVDAPAGNASLEAWQEFALTKGFTAEDIEGKSRDDLRAALV